ncbi:phosphopantetheine-binding protein [Kibdelosporangium aridum]|uniref:Acyl carrier protein n=1 Tax=Kibdelosporangium aridum TaxID=2030 RepID=A0A1W1ZJ41_KIBAR|nr:phosphopantetheine-binding protein [Kibdelosporangium aridum]SMC48560.1 acyl carrier protein [Kibdelosporangium aridum]
MIDEVERWILSAHPEIETLDPDVDLIEQRLIDSLRFVQFIVLLEKLCGSPIDVATLDIDSVRTLSAIQRTYFA